MTAYSANLGFLWTELPLPDAIRAAARAGFDAVECHFPFDVPTGEIVAALEETGLPMMGLNTSRGNVAAGESGLAAVPGREAAARAVIDEAIAYAAATGTRAVHVMAGFAAGPGAEATFLANLAYAADHALDRGVTILIEPLNHYDAPGYFLTTTDQATALIGRAARPNLKLMFDCYHVQLMEGDVSNRLRRLLPLIGHVQFAAVPDRGAPDHGELSYAHVFAVLRDLGYDAPLGAEYRPNGPTEPTLGWMSTLDQT